ncbi:MAG: NosD domain-containing protein [Candidatus Bipolaricaulota bacterium]
MGRKVAWAAAVLLTAIASAGLVGGQVGGQFLWWGSHEPIYIYGDEGFTYANGVMSGSGTAADPYVIEGWRVEAPNADYGIYVDHTTKHFVIRDCVFERARIAGVVFNTVRNGRLEGSQISLSDTAVYLLNSSSNVIEGNVIAESRYGVMMATLSRDNLIVGNSFFSNGLAARDPEGRNVWYDANGGNYWDEYDGVDADGDGFGDTPYYAIGDHKPLLTSPAQLTQVESAGPSYAGNLVAPDGSLVVTSQTPITLTSKDPGSGLAEIRYSIDGATWLTYTGPIYLAGADGPRRITYYGIDRLGNSEPKRTAPFLLDNHAPVTVLEVGEPKYVDGRGTWVTSATRLTLRRTQESTYGKTTTYYQVNEGPWLVYSTPFALVGEDGARAVTFYSRNASGVTEEPQTVILYKDDAPPTSRGAQASDPDAVSVSVGPAPTEAPTATVTAEPEAAATPSETVPPTSTPAQTAAAPSATVGGPAPATQTELAGAALGQTGSPGRALDGQEETPSDGVQTGSSTAYASVAVAEPQTASETVAPTAEGEPELPAADESGEADPDAETSLLPAP